METQDRLLIYVLGGAEGNGVRFCPLVWDGVLFQTHWLSVSE